MLNFLYEKDGAKYLPRFCHFCGRLVMPHVVVDQLGEFDRADFDHEKECPGFRYGGFRGMWE